MNHFLKNGKRKTNQADEKTLNVHVPCNVTQHIREKTVRITGTNK